MTTEAASRKEFVDATEKQSYYRFEVTTIRICGSGEIFYLSVGVSNSRTKGFINAAGAQNLAVVPVKIWSLVTS